jgi:DNA repair protein RadC
MARIIKYKTKLTENKRVTLEKEVSNNIPELSYIVRCPEDVTNVGKTFMRIHEEPEEHMYMICMNTKNRIIGVFEVSHGNVNSSIVGIREIFQKALLANAVSIILMHNHPSGDCTPSREDVDVTKKLVEAGKLIGISVLDHIIVGDNYSSLKDKGYI